MNVRTFVCGTGIALLTASAAYCGPDGARNSAPAAALGDATLAEVIPGQSTKAEIQSLLGTPWRVVQFNDCGQAMDGQADETWEYRGRDPSGTYRFHVEFDNHDIAQLVAKIPDEAPDGEGTTAKIGTTASTMRMPM